MIERTVKPAQLVKFLGINPRRLHLWAETGLISEEQKIVGQGKARRYNYYEVLISTVLQRLLDLTRSRKFSGIWKDQLFTEIGKIVNYVRNGPRVIESKTGEEQSKWIAIYWDTRPEKPDWHVTHYSGGKEPLSFAKFRPRGVPFIMLPFTEIEEEVKEFFDKEATL